MLEPADSRLLYRIKNMTDPITSKKHFWPSPATFLDLSHADLMVTGYARCIGVALCNDTGAAVRFFYQGQLAHFYYEFEALQLLGVPGGGVEIHDGLGRLVHGKNSFQYRKAIASLVQPGTRLRFHQVIRLDIAPGEYRFSIGLAMTSADMDACYWGGSILDEEFRRSLQELCRVMYVSSFQVELDPAGRLLHYGLANLPGDCQISLVEASNAAPQSVAPTIHRWGLGRMLKLRPFVVQPAVSSDPTITSAFHSTTAAQPAVFHVTHWKAGSQWIYKILKGCGADQIVAPQLGEHQFLRWPLQPGKIYPTVYVSEQQFMAVQLPLEWRRFVIIRDLRDTLISAYFSLKLSHTEQLENATLRARLQSLSLDAGLRLLMDEWLPGCARIQLSWQEAGEPIIRYEDLLEHDLEILEPLLLDECKLAVDRALFREVVLANRFERLTQGRARGHEDVRAHERKGISGDWRNYFSEQIKRMFKNRYGGVLISTGYETDLNW